MALTITSKWDSSSANSRLVTVESSGHWYDAEGRSAHVILGKNGKERNTTVADARKMGLLPSVTSVQGILHKEQLVSWRIEQAIMSALTLPKEENETLEDYARRVVKDSKESTTKAANHGTRMHEQAENILMGRAVCKDEDLQPYIATFRKWSEENIEKTYWCEKGLVGAGYAGRSDAYVRMKGVGDAMIDLKNRKVNKKYNAAPWYPTDAQQLWAYRNASENPKCACVSVVLASNDPEYIMHHQWDEDELYQAGIAFCAMQKVWAWVKGYTPPGMKL
jgi:hypothetical protein